jgi:hypothetical protein
MNGTFVRLIMVQADLLTIGALEGCAMMAMIWLM